MQKIIIDTNFVLSTTKFKIKTPQGNLIIPSGVISELERIAKSKRKDAVIARIALQIIEKKNLKIFPTHGYVDRAIVNYASTHKCIVATNDRNLIKALKANEIKVLRIRQKKYVVEQ